MVERLNSLLGLEELGIIVHALGNLEQFLRGFIAAYNEWCQLDAGRTTPAGAGRGRYGAMARCRPRPRTTFRPLRL